jgi:MFS family permease
MHADDERVVAHPAERARTARAGVVHARSGRRAWAMWALGASGYLVAVFHRTSLAVGALAAERRLHIGPAALATLGAVELAVYVVMQVPSGAGGDRYGPRRMIAGGFALLAAGALCLAWAGGLLVALLGRVLVGVGDACMWVNVLRLARGWFRGGRYALVVSLTSVAGSLGQLVATTPLALALSSFGWVATYTAAAAVTAAVGVLAALRLVDHDPDRPPEPVVDQGGWTGTREGLRASWAEPGTRLALWAHLGLVGAYVAFAALWAFPYLVEAGRRSGGSASGIIGVGIVVSLLASPLLGVFVGRYPQRRADLLIGSLVADVLVWALLVVVPATSLPTAALLGAVVVLSVSSAAAFAVFDLVRTSNPLYRAGRAAGLVNMGGFSAAVAAELAIGGLLDLLRRAGWSVPASYEAALAVPLLLALGALVQVLRLRREVVGAASPPLRESGAAAEGAVA